MRGLIYGIGINDADYSTRYTVKGKRVMCPFYRTWMSMLVRCYSEKLQQSRPTYIGCSVCEEWLTFSNFKKWMEKQDFEGKQLDKDLLISGNKEYSPESCIFVYRTLNTMLLDRAAGRRGLPLGVSYKSKSLRLVSQIMLTGKKKHLGYFLTPKEAHKAWQQAKKALIFNVAMEQTNEKLRAALLLRCDQLQYDIDNGLETIKL